MVYIAILGYGTVGSGVMQIVKENQDILKRKTGKDIQVKYVLDIREFPGDPVNEVLTHNYEDILQDDQVKVVVEVMGGLEPAYTFVKSALQKGKSVVTSNKELVAKYGPELIQMAKERKLNFLFEASVGGGIPIIRPFNSSLTADRILEISGILNGTTNYILTEMEEKGKSFEEALKDAQELGYAERNPSADIEGFDACRKIAILASLAYGKTVDFEDIQTEGISNITVQDMLYAKKLGGVIKLIGNAKCTEKGVYARVAPYIISKNHPLSFVNGAFNAIVVTGNMLGDTMYYGSGAGKLPTASAVVSDVVDVVKHEGVHVMIDWKDEKLEIINIHHAPARFFVRAAGSDIEKIKEAVCRLFPDMEFVALEEAADEIGFVTPWDTELHLHQKLKELNQAGVEEIRNIIHMEG